MPSVCFYFQVHQPLRLRPYSAFEVGHAHDHFDGKANAGILRKVAAKCYLPANAVLLDLIRRHEGRFRVAFSISGCALEQMARHAPEALWSFQALARTGCAEFLGETYYHSLAALYDTVEFREQVRLQEETVERHFGSRPSVFRNTELVYSDALGEQVADLGYRGVLAEGADDVLGWRSPRFLYRHPRRDLALLLKSYRLSDDVAFRFSNRSWSEYPLTAEKYALWVQDSGLEGEVVNLFMDYETFGEHQWEETGIFAFLRDLPGRILAHPAWSFKTPSEVVRDYAPRDALSFGRLVSWADTERDLSAWNGNRMQQDALASVYALGSEVRARNNPATLDLWRKLQTSDHFYYMCTKWFADGDVHAYFSPYESPYKAYLTYMNVLKDFEVSVLGKVAVPTAEDKV